MMERAGCLLLLTLALPVMILAAAAVALTSPGPVTVRNASMAAEGRLVFLSQFRTTYCHPGDGGARENGHSRAVTPVGKILRLSGIVRLPVLTDIWAGRIGLRHAFRA